MKSLPTLAVLTVTITSLAFWATPPAVQAEGEPLLPVERTITDIEGRTVDISAVSIGWNEVRVRRVGDNREFTIPLSTLSEEDRTWLNELAVKALRQEDAEDQQQTDPINQSSNELERVIPVNYRYYPSTEIILAHRASGVVPPPLGWDALETTIEFNDGRTVDGYVYEMKEGRIWYAGQDRIQKSAPVGDLSAYSWLEINRWRNRLILVGSPSVRMNLDGQAIFASIIPIEPNAAPSTDATLLTEGGELLRNISLDRLCDKSQAFTGAWKDGRWVPTEYEWVIEPEFTAAKPLYRNRHALVLQKGKWGVIDRTGTFIIEPRFDEVEQIAESRNIRVRESRLWGLLGEDLSILAPPLWDEVGDLHQGAIPVKRDGKWGYVNKEGDLVIPCQWDDAWRFSQAGLAIVTLDGKRGFIDRTGRVVVPTIWDGAIMHSPEGVGAVRRGQGWALVDTDGNLLCDPVWRFRWEERQFELGYIPAWPAEQRTARVSTFLGTDGNPDATPRLREGIALPRLPGPFLGRPQGRERISLPTPSGNEVLIEETHAAAGGLAAVRVGSKWGFASAKGLVIEPQWDQVGRFSQGLVSATIYEPETDSRNARSLQWKFLNPDGETVIPSGTLPPMSRWQSAPEFRNGALHVRQHHSGFTWYEDRGRPHSTNPNAPESIPGQPFPKSAEETAIGLIDLAGNIVLQPEWDAIGVLSTNLFTIRRGGKWGLAKKTRERGAKAHVFMAPDYQAIALLNDNFIWRKSATALQIVCVDTGEVHLEEAPSANVRQIAHGSFVITHRGSERVYWDDGTPVFENAPNRLSFVGRYGSGMILREGPPDNPEAWWHVDATTQQPRLLENTSRVYWNDSLAEHLRIWLKDSTTGKWRFCSIDGRHLGPEMDDTPAAWFMDGGLGIMWEGDHCYFINENGKRVGPDSLEDARLLRFGLAAVMRNGKWGFMDATGTMVKDFIYDEVGDFFVASTDREATEPLLAAVCMDESWGYINHAGHLVIPLVGETRGRWMRGVIAFASRDRTWEFTDAYDPQGNRVEVPSRVAPPRPNPYAGEWSIFKGPRGRSGIADPTGITVLDPDWLAIGWLAPELAAIRGKYDGGLFSPEKGWLFRDNDVRRIRRNPRGRIDRSLITHGHMIIEKTPKWGYARWKPTTSGDLLAHYKLEGDALDASGNNLHATLHHTSWVADKFGNPNSALYFDGTQSFGVVPIDINPAVLPELTMVTWAKADSASPVQQLLSHGDGGYDRSLGIVESDDLKGWGAHVGSGGVMGGHAVTEGEWTFLAVSYQNPDTVILHVNDQVYRGQGRLGSGVNNLYIGMNPGYGQYFMGAMDQIQIYDRVLPPHEIHDLYQEFLGDGKPRPTEFSIHRGTEVFGAARGVALRVGPDTPTRNWSAGAPVEGAKYSVSSITLTKGNNDSTIDNLWIGVYDSIEGNLLGSFLGASVTSVEWGKAREGDRLTWEFSDVNFTVADDSHLLFVFQLDGEAQRTPLPQAQVPEGATAIRRMDRGALEPQEGAAVFHWGRPTWILEFRVPQMEVEIVPVEAVGD